MPGSIGAELERTHRAADRLLALDPDTVPGPDAMAAVGEATLALRKLLLFRARMARRVEVTGAYATTGAKDPASWYAGETKEPMGKAAGELRRARRVERMPELADAAEKGELSGEQADAIAEAVEADPHSERELVETAKRATLRQTRDRVERVKARARSEEDETARRERAHQGRHLRTWVDDDGAGRLEAQLTAEALAVFEACLEPFVERLLGPGSERAGRPALRADALLALAQAAASGPGGRLTPTVCLHVDLPAFLRGATDGEEACALDGVGSVPVALAREWFGGDALLQLVVRHGVDVTTVVTDTRHISKALDVALRHRQPRCAVAGCDATVRLERDHIQPFAEGGPTSYENLQLLCGYHHGLKTRAKCRFVAGPEGLQVLSPEEYAERRRAEAEGKDEDTAPTDTTASGATPAGRTRTDVTPARRRPGRRPAAPPPAHGPPSSFDTA